MLTGTLDDFALTDVFRLISLARKTGRLDVARRAGTGKVFFHRGEVTCAESSLVREPLGQKLVRAGALTEGQLRRALDERAASGERIGRILVAAGTVNARELEDAVRGQTEDAVFDLLRWERGEFMWEPGHEVETEVPVAVSVENLIMEASRRLDELDIITRKIPSAESVVAMAVTPPEGAVEINIAPEEWRLLVLVDGARSVREIATAVGLDDFGAMRTLYGLVSAGLIDVTPGADASEDGGRAPWRTGPRSGSSAQGRSAPLEPFTIAPEDLRPAPEPPEPAVDPFGSSPAPEPFEAVMEHDVVGTTPVDEEEPVPKRPPPDEVEAADGATVGETPSPRLPEATGGGSGAPEPWTPDVPAPDATPATTAPEAFTETEAEPELAPGTDVIGLEEAEVISLVPPTTEEAPPEVWFEDPEDSSESEEAPAIDVAPPADAGGDLNDRDPAVAAASEDPLAADLEQSPSIPPDADVAEPRLDRSAVVRELAGLFSDTEGPSSRRGPALQPEPEPGPEPAAPAAEQRGAGQSGGADDRKRVEDDDQVTKGLISRLIDGVKGL